MRELALNEKPESDFEKAKPRGGGVGFVREFWEFLGQTKKWWLLPVLVVILLFGLLVFLSGTAAAPFIYTIFGSCEVLWP